MINLQNIYEEVLVEFAEALKERSGVDNSYLDNDTIDELIKQITSNMQNKNDLFNKHRIVEDVGIPIFQVQESLESKTESEQEQLSESIKESCEEIYANHKYESFKQKLVKKSVDNQQMLEKERNQKQWEQDYTKQHDLTEKVRIESKKSADYHISAIYNLKSKKYIASKNQEQISLNLAIIKSETQEALITGLQARLTKGDKNKVLNLCTKKEESIKRECSYEQKLVLLKQMLN